MLFGVCSSYENAAFLKECGYDYIEMPLAVVAAMSEEEFEKCNKTLCEADIKALSFNCFFPGNIKLIGPRMDLNTVREYTQKAVERASVLGAQTLVLGSGGSRNIDEKLDREECENQFVQVLKTVGEIAGEHSVTVVIEPLNKNETNLINTVPEAVRFAKLCGCENVKALVDFYHFSLENEPDHNITDFKGDIAHIHLARGSADRGVPKEENINDLKKLAGLLKQIGYDNKLSIEAAFNDFKAEIQNVRPLLEAF